MISTYLDTKNADKPDWFLFDFFQKLKDEAGIDLTLNQYQLLLHCLLSKPIVEVEELRLLLQTLWLTKEKFRLEFDRLFNDAIKKHIVQSQQNTNHVNSLSPKIDDKAFAERNNKPEEDIDIKNKGTDKSKTKKKTIEPPIGNTSDVSKLPEPDTKQDINIIISEDGKHGDLNKTQIKTSNFILSDFKYLPFNTRAMEQGWRKMRGKTKYITTTQLDIKNMVKTTSQQGFVDSLIYERKSKGCQKVVWLSDNGGSMAPFAYWDDQLYAIMNEVPNTEVVERYYFHDFPPERLNIREENDYLFFENRSHTKAKYLSEILKKTDGSTIFVIFSDGGAARKREDMERVKVFIDVCNKIRFKSRNLSWINPVKNLGMSSALYISSFIQTEYPSNRGISKLFQNL